MANYYLLAGGHRLLGLLPVAAFDPLARMLAWIFARVLPLRRAVVEENLGIAFGDLDDAARRRLLHGIYRHTILFLFESARLMRLKPEEILAAVDDPSGAAEQLLRMQTGNRGFVLPTGHYGNWEWLGAWTALVLGRPFGAVFKPMHHVPANRLMIEQRQRLGIRPFSTRTTRPHHILAFVRSGGVLGILSDQDARRRGEFLPFFGREASTAIGLGRLTVMLNKSQVILFLQRTAPCRFRILAHYLPIPDLPDKTEAAREVMRQYHAALEEAIRSDPEQYFWWHRRWKTKRKRKRRRRAASVVLATDEHS